MQCSRRIIGLVSGLIFGGLLAAASAGSIPVQVTPEQAKVLEMARSANTGVYKGLSDQEILQKMTDSTLKRYEGFRTRRRGANAEPANPSN